LLTQNFFDRPKLKFRNYVPRDPELKKGVIKIEEDIVKDVKAQFAKFGAVQEDEVPVRSFDSASLTY
jgi:hypothetical protein